MHPSIDIKLLRSFLALVSEAHVTRAAARLGISQPAMSATLSRLRRIMADPILVRTDAGMMPTPRARELAITVQNALTSIDQAILGTQSFEPENAEMEFNILASESVTYLLLAPLIAKVHKLAPRILINIQRTSADMIQHHLERGNFDMVVSFLLKPPQNVRARPLINLDLKVAVAASHSSIRGELSLEQYLQTAHVSYTTRPNRPATIERCVDEAIEKLGHRREISVRIFSPLSSLLVVSRSELIATMPEGLISIFGQTLALQILPPPLKLPPVELVMYWHERTHNSAAHRWLRNELKAIAGKINSAARS